MANDTESITPETKEGTGLRGRKKARRRQEILRYAAELFEQDGFDATTMAEIAHESGVSPPTVFNYFGSKENILSALIFEGTERERSQHLNSPRKTNCSFATVLGDLLCEISENTMRIAGKRVWRYAEAANIRRPNSEFEQQFVRSDAAVVDLIARFLGDYDIVLRNRAVPDLRFLAQLMFDRWTALYFTYIKDDAMLIETHNKQIRVDAQALTSLLFDDRFAEKSPLGTPELSS